MMLYEFGIKLLPILTGIQEMFGVFMKLLQILVGIQEIFGREVISCPSSSCAGRCGEMSDRSHFCNCDVRCHVLGDCCPDAHRHCFATVEEDIFWWTPEAKIIRQSRQCVSMSLAVEVGNNKKFPYWSSHDMLGMIVSCPDDTDDGKECRDTESSLVHGVPVCHAANQLLYRNVWCAKCHGIDPSELHPFQIWLQNCPNVINVSDATGKLNDPDDIMPPQTTCPGDTYYNIPDECASITRRMKCFYSTDRVSNLSSPCHLYKNPLSYIQVRRPISFRNQFCVPEEHVDPLTCYREEKSDTIMTTSPVRASFAILLSFDDNDPTVSVNLIGEKTDNSPSSSSSDGRSRASNGVPNLKMTKYMYHMLLGYTVKSLI